MTILFGIILAIIVFSVIVFFHELGHFSSAKLFGVRVDEFGIGIPPRALTLFHDKSGTAYTLNWLPIGGFVKMKGEEAIEHASHDPESLASKPYYQQSIVILAGVAMNFLFAIVIFSILFMVGVEPLAVNTKFATQTETRLIPSLDRAVSEGFLNVDGLILSPLKGSVAERAGIREGDILYRIDGKDAKTPEDMISRVKSATQPLSLELRRNKETQMIIVSPEGGKVGSYVGYNVTGINHAFRYRYGFFEAIGAGISETYLQSKLTLELFGNLLSKIFIPKAPTDREEAVKSLGGPIAVGSLFVELIHAKAGIVVVTIIAALISVNLGVFNLLPFPALDGGRFVFLSINSLITRVFGRRVVTGKIEHWIHIAGFTLLIGVSIFVAYNDILKLWVR